MFGPQQLAEDLRFILSRSPASPGLPILVDLIANPAAGGFTRPAYAKRRSAELATLRFLAETLPARDAATTVGLHLTGRAGHATEIARGIIAEARARGYPPALRIIMTAGGDGTSLESVSALMELSPEERANWLVLRLPLGTGNDGSEGRDLGVALGRFLGPCGVGSRSAIRAIPNPKGGREALWSFNIASVGVDAFVGDLTNRFKTSFPGDSYKVMLDLAAVIYDLIWPSHPIRIQVSGPAGERVIDGDCLLLAFGASGNRQYGSNKRILPGPENSCLVPRMSLWGKLKIKGPLSDGGHAAFPNVKLFSANRLVIEYPAPLLFQVDGEVYRFEPADFPLTLELIEDAYRVIEPASK
ncbi:MAG: diacylglycerol/lipid kinase family protein [Rectinemataceae bacterium]